MVSTQIKTVAELESLLKAPDQLAEYIGQVAIDSMGASMSDTIKAVVEKVAGEQQRKAAIAALPGRVPMDQASAIASKAWSSWKGGADAPVARKAYGSENGNYQSVREYLGDLFAVRQNRGVSERLAKAAFAEGNGGAGGFLVPPEFNATLRALALENAQIRPRATVLPMSSMEIRMPYIRDTSHATNVFGGVQGYWSAEAGTLTESETTFAEVLLRAHKLTGYTVASNEIMADAAIGLEAFIGQRFPQAIKWFEEKAFWTGNGQGLPLGILNATALISVARQQASHIVFEDLVNMDSQILPSSADNVVWFAHPKCKQDLYTMALSVGTGGSAIFLNAFNGGATVGPPASIFGRPLVFSEHLPVLGTAGDLVAADLSYYLIGDRQDLAMEASAHVKFTNDQTVWRFIERLDGRPWIDSALTLQDGSFQVSPFVQLQ